MSEDTGNPSVTTSPKVLTGEEYRKYLERGGVLDALKRVLVILYEEPEWPINPNEYLCKKLAELCEIPLMEKLKNDVHILQDQVKSLEQTVNNLNEELNKYKSGMHDNDTITSPNFQRASDISASNVL